MHRVVAAALVRDEQVLLCRRRADRPWYPGAWDLPGGHREAGETPGETLARECREELGITVRAPVLLPLEHEAAADPDVDITVFVVRAFDGEPADLAPEEHDDIGWFDEIGVRALPLVDARLLPVLLRALGT